MGMEGCGELYQKRLEVTMLFFWLAVIRCADRGKSTNYQIGVHSFRGSVIDLYLVYFFGCLEFDSIILFIR